MNNNENLTDKAYELVHLLTSKGCKTIYQNDENDFFQVLMLDGNSGSIFSIETLPWMNSAEIRTNRNQRYEFPTEDIVNRIGTDAPLFSDYTVENYWDIPFVPLAQEIVMLDFYPLFARIDVLQGAPEEAALIYYTTGTVPGVAKEKVLETEMQYQQDVNHFNSQMNNIINQKMNLLPEPVQKFYNYNDKRDIDLYDGVFIKKR